MNLSESFQAGRLTSEELEDRTGRALSARTVDELDALTADLPAAGPAGMTEPESAERPWGQGLVRLPMIAVVAVVVIAGVLAGTAVAGHASRFLWLLIAVPLVARRLALGRGRPGSGPGLLDRRHGGPWMLD